MYRLSVIAVIAICRRACFRRKRISFLAAFALSLAVGAALGQTWSEDRDRAFDHLRRGPLFLFHVLPSAEVSIEAVRYPRLAVRGIEVKYTSRGSQRIDLTVNIDEVVIADGMRLHSLKLTCRAAATRDDKVACANGTLRVTLDDHEPIRLNFSGAYDRNGTATLDLPMFELAILSSLIAKFQPDLVLTAGQVSTKLRFGYGPTGSSVRHLSVIADFSDVSFDGASVAENASGRMRIGAIIEPDATRVEFATNLDSGALYVEPGFEVNANRPGFLLEVPTGDEPISVSGVVSLENERSLLHIEQLVLDHPDVIDCVGGSEVVRGKLIEVLGVEVGCTVANTRALYETYLRPMLYGTALDELDLAGGLEFDMDIEQGELLAGSFRFFDFHIDDLKQRFGISGLDGEVAINLAEAPRYSGITWQNGHVFELPFAAGVIDFVSQRGILRTTRVDDIQVLDGAFTIDTFEIERPGKADARVAVAGQLTPITLSELAAVLGWPPLGGQISGTIPTLTYTRRAITLDGSVDVSIFDGSITVDEFSIDDLFGVVPHLYANVHVDDLDLAQLTEAASFGNIEGRLSGYISDIRLEQWKPESFDAFFASPSERRGRRRISQKAVDNLGQIGAGAVSPLSSGWLSFIPSYSYGEIGLGCRLRNGHCLLSGIEGVGGDEAGGFTLLSPGGLLPPWIEIKGAGRIIGWESLLDGFAQITQGEVAVSVGE